MFDNILNRKKEGSGDEAEQPGDAFAEMLMGALGMGGSNDRHANGQRVGNQFNESIDAYINAEAARKKVSSDEINKTAEGWMKIFSLEQELAIQAIRIIAAEGADIVEELNEIDRTLVAAAKILRGIGHSLEVNNVLRLYEVVEDEEVKAFLWKKLEKVINVEALSGEEESES